MDKLTPSEQTVFDYICEHLRETRLPFVGIHVRTIAPTLGMSRTTVFRALQGLRERGYIVHTKQRHRASNYILGEAGKAVAEQDGPIPSIGSPHVWGSKRNRATFPAPPSPRQPFLSKWSQRHE